MTPRIDAQMAEPAAGAVYTLIRRDPRMMEALVREANRARAVALSNMAIGATRAIVRFPQAAWRALAGALRHARNVASGELHPPARRC
jgi:hypothetical protein